MSMRYRLANRPQVFDGLPPRQTAVLQNDVFERPTGSIFHNKIGSAVCGCAMAMRGGHVGVVRQLTHDLQLTTKATASGVVEIMEHLHRHLSLEVLVPGGVYRTEPTTADSSEVPQPVNPGVEEVLLHILSAPPWRHLRCGL